MKTPSVIYKWCCPACGLEEDFKWIGDKHLECQACLHVDIEEMFVECPDELTQEVLDNMKRRKV
jgi:hypothetical protein